MRKTNEQANETIVDGYAHYYVFEMDGKNYGVQFHLSTEPIPTGSNATYDIPQDTDLETWHEIVKTRPHVDEDGDTVEVGLTDEEISVNAKKAFVLCQDDADDWAREHGLTSYVYEDDETPSLLRRKVPALTMEAVCSMAATRISKAN
jgi:hypothetical protein